MRTHQCRPTVHCRRRAVQLPLLVGRWADEPRQVGAAGPRVRFSCGLGPAMEGCQMGGPLLVPPGLALLAGCSQRGFDHVPHGKRDARSLTDSCICGSGTEDADRHPVADHQGDDFAVQARMGGVLRCYDCLRGEPQWWRGRPLFAIPCGVPPQSRGFHEDFRAWLFVPGVGRLSVSLRCPRDFPGGLAVPAGFRDGRALHVDLRLGGERFGQECRRLGEGQVAGG